ncbi:MAG: hypothetical protein C0513_04710 [Isosphaera sp.]|nr:hypothetical protein [Isosphaera sp.]
MSKIVAGIIVAAGLAAPAMAQSTVSSSAPWDVDVRILADGDPASPYTGSGVEILPGMTPGIFRLGLVLQARANVAAGFFNGGIGRFFEASNNSRFSVLFSHNVFAFTRLVAGDIGTGFNSTTVGGPSGGTGFETAAGNASGVSGSIFRGGNGTTAGINLGATTSSGFIDAAPLGGSTTTSSFAATSSQFFPGSVTPVQNFATSATEVSTSPYQSIYRFVLETTTRSVSDIQITVQGTFARFTGFSAVTGVGSLSSGGASLSLAAVAGGTDPLLSTPVASAPSGANNRGASASITITIPTPGAAALLGLCGLAAARRRR